MAQKVTVTLEDEFDAGRRASRVASFQASVREHGGRVRGRPPCSHCRYFLAKNTSGSLRPCGNMKSVTWSRLSPQAK
jgi:hypothetical protein